LSGGDETGGKEQREPDWLDRILDELQAKKEQRILFPRAPFLNELMKREREGF